MCMCMWVCVCSWYIVSYQDCMIEVDKWQTDWISPVWDYQPTWNSNQTSLYQRTKKLAWYNHPLNSCFLSRAIKLTILYGKGGWNPALIGNTRAKPYTNTPDYLRAWSDVWKKTKCWKDNIWDKPYAANTPIHQIISELVQIFEEKKGTKTKRLTDNT